jgi:RNA polymerase sigma-70 factor (ECF subfamily)
VDEGAFTAFYREHAQDVLVFFTRRSYDVEVALDLTAETFAQAFASRRGFRGSSEAEARAWLFGIASHQFAGYVRRGRANRRLLRRLGVEVPAPDDAERERILELAGLRSRRAIVAQELARLSAEQRDALRLRVVDELSYTVVAQRFGITEQAARMRVSRGLAALARALDQMPGGLEEPS